MRSAWDRTKPELLTRALRSQSTIFHPAAVQAWFAREAPWVDPLWVEGTLEAGTVNNPARRHFPSPRDLVFGRRDGSLERYDPVRHGRWSSLGRQVDAGELAGRGMGRWPMQEEAGDKERRAS